MFSTRSGVVLVDPALVSTTIREHSFQVSFWRDVDRVGSFGRALKADWVVLGELNMFGHDTMLPVQLFDVNKMSFVRVVPSRMSNINEAPAVARILVDQIVRLITGNNEISVRTSPPQPISDPITQRPTTPDPSPSSETVAQRPSTPATTPSSDSITQKPADPATPSYKLGGIGPAGGIIFFDKGSISDGWRYLEAAPARFEFKARFGLRGIDVPGTGTAVGTGKRNTELIMGMLKRHNQGSMAADLASNLEINGFRDWFLPSNDELNMMYENLHQKGLGGFSNSWYLSSSQYSTRYVWSLGFRYGNQEIHVKGSQYRVRAVRAF
jgi:hypothetical protein